MLYLFVLEVRVQQFFRITSLKDRKYFINYKTRSSLFEILRFSSTLVI